MDDDNQPKTDKRFNAAPLWIALGTVFVVVAFFILMIFAIRLLSTRKKAEELPRTPTLHHPDGRPTSHGPLFNVNSDSSAGRDPPPSPAGWSPSPTFVNPNQPRPARLARLRNVFLPAPSFSSPPRAPRPEPLSLTGATRATPNSATRQIRPHPAPRRKRTASALSIACIGDASQASAIAPLSARHRLLQPSVGRFLAAHFLCPPRTSALPTTVRNTISSPQMGREELWRISARMRLQSLESARSATGMSAANVQREDRLPIMSPGTGSPRLGTWEDVVGPAYTYGGGIGEVFAGGRVQRQSTGVEEQPAHPGRRVSYV